MAEFQKSKNPQRVAHSKVTILVLFAFSVILLIGLFNIVLKQRDTQEKKRRVVDALNLLKAQNATLQSEIESLKTQEGIEEKIREKFRVVKEGEGLVVIVDEKKEVEYLPAVKTNVFLDFLKNIF